MVVDSEVDSTALLTFGFVDAELLLSGIALNSFGFITGFSDIWTNIDTPLSTTWTVIDI